MRKATKYRPVSLPPKPPAPHVPVRIKQEVTRVLQKWVGKPPETLGNDAGWMK